MIKIQILGMGCPKCRMLATETEKVAKAMGIDYTLEKVEKMDDIMSFGVMMTPALAINGVVKSAGKLLNQDEIRKYLA